MVISRHNNLSRAFSQKQLTAKIEVFSVARFFNSPYSDYSSTIYKTISCLDRYFSILFQ